VCVAFFLKNNVNYEGFSVNMRHMHMILAPLDSSFHALSNGTKQHRSTRPPTSAAGTAPHPPRPDFFFFFSVLFQPVLVSGRCFTANTHPTQLILVSLESP
jgi:hypothetical protein